MLMMGLYDEKLRKILTSTNKNESDFRRNWGNSKVYGKSLTSRGTRVEELVLLMELEFANGREVLKYLHEVLLLTDALYTVQDVREAITLLEEKYNRYDYLAREWDFLACLIEKGDGISE